MHQLKVSSNSIEDVSGSCMTNYTFGFQLLSTIPIDCSEVVVYNIKEQLLKFSRVNYTHCTWLKM